MSQSSPASRTSLNARKINRKSFGRIPQVTDIPDLIEMQKSSYDSFLRIHPDAGEKRRGDRLDNVFGSFFPIEDISGRLRLEFVGYSLEHPKYDVEECRHRGMTYNVPLKVRLRLVVFEKNESTGERSMLNSKEQDVLIADIPLMTENGTFIVNGAERVVVSQMHRSPGVFFDHDKGKTHPSGKRLYSGRIIPYRGSWLDFEFDARDNLYARIDRRRKFPVSTLLYALGLSAEKILLRFYEPVRHVWKEKYGAWSVDFVPDFLRGVNLSHDLVDSDSGEVLVSAGRRVSQDILHELKQKEVKSVLASDEEVLRRYVAKSILAKPGQEIDEKLLKRLKEVGSFESLNINHVTIGSSVRDTLISDKCDGKEQALAEIYRIMRPGEPPAVETAEKLFHDLFFEKSRYDLSAVGRVKMNSRLGIECSDDIGVLRREDIIKVIQTLVGLHDGRGESDDIDNLGNRRVRSVGELIENQFRIGLLRLERSVRERMNTLETDNIMPQDLVNAKPVTAVLREFFGSSQLSQFMDQTNPLAEVTHKRRLSALGPGGLTRDRAGFEVRDVHPSHYGRICPVETPEGPNIGLISSLASYARIDKYGFIESPYRRVLEGKVTDEVSYLSTIEESKYRIAQANEPLTSDGGFERELVNCRFNNGNFEMVSPNRVDFIDVSPKQIVSIAAALIPFLENDDANRALMGSNMQRQAVPLLRAKAPLVGTGVESVVARDSGAAIACKRAGVVDQVDATRIVVRVNDANDPVDIYNLRKFERSNQNTCINQRPLVQIDDKVEPGDIIADGPSTKLGELALGRDVLVAFMPWNGYNFEDSILLSERIVRDDVFTSVHIEEYEVMSRIMSGDSNIGEEEITRDIPNVGEEALRNLDEEGIVYVGAEVHPGDVLVGKVTPKGETTMTPEEKLLHAIFGDKASDVRDTSLRLPSGSSGTVVEVRIFNRRGVKQDQRLIGIEKAEVERLQRDQDDERKIRERYVYKRLADTLLSRIIASGPEGISSGQPVTSQLLGSMDQSQWWKIGLKDDKARDKVENLRKQYEDNKKLMSERFDDKLRKLRRSDELPAGVMKKVKVFVAVKRKLQPGDKMAGRHGNKGVISRIVSREDMPYLADGRTIDVVLNPLGVPSRMNVGQILETHLGWACAGVGRKIDEALEHWHSAEEDEEKTEVAEDLRGIVKRVCDTDIKEDEFLVEFSKRLTNGIPVATPVFDGALESEIVALLEEAGLDPSGQETLYDGRTGMPFARQVTVGYIYMLKLHHLIDDKIHARSIGPYSLVTQQPLGGKAQFGGQRFGEMEVWALEAYGAAYTLQEMLTVKSDDVAGRSRVYESIVRGQNVFEAGVPESFNVLVREMRSLGLDVEEVSSEQQP